MARAALVTYVVYTHSGILYAELMHTLCPSASVSNSCSMSMSVIPQFALPLPCIGAEVWQHPHVYHTRELTRDIWLC